MKDLIKNAVRYLAPAILLTSALVGCGGAYSPPTYYSVGGTVSGLVSPGQLTLRNNGGDVLTVSANGAFKFATGVLANGDYAVTVQTQPAGLVCAVVGNGIGKIRGAAISNVQVDCIPSDFTVAVRVSGTTVVNSLFMATFVGQPPTIPGNYETFVGISDDISGNTPVEEWVVGPTGVTGRFGAGAYGLIINTGLTNTRANCRFMSGQNATGSANASSTSSPNSFVDIVTGKVYPVVPVTLTGGGDAVMNILCDDFNPPGGSGGSGGSGG